MQHLAYGFLPTEGDKNASKLTMRHHRRAEARHAGQVPASQAEADAECETADGMAGEFDAEYDYANESVHMSTSGHKRSAVGPGPRQRAGWRASQTNKDRHGVDALPHMHVCIAMNFSS